MAALAERARAAAQSEHGRRLLRFAAVSLISTAITQAILAITYDAIGIPSAIGCNVIATGFSTIPAYFLNRNWTWQKRGKSHPLREVAPFWVISFVGLALSTVSVGLAAHNADSLFYSHVLRRAFVSFASLATYAIIWVGRYAIFNRYLFGSKAGPKNPEGVEPPAEVEAMVLESHEQTAKARKPGGPPMAAAEG